MIPCSRFALLVGSGLVSAAVLLTGCGADPDKGTNGVAELSPGQIEKRTRDAVGGARAVRMSGTVVSKGERFRLDMRLKAGGGVGQVTNGGRTFELLRVGKELFLKADEAFYRDRAEGSSGGKDGGAGKGSGTGGSGAGAASGGKGGADAEDSAARKLEGKYVKVPEGDPAYKQLSGFTDMRVLVGVFFVLEGKLEKDGRRTVRGIPTVVLKAGGGSGGAVDVALDGEPYPLRYKRAGRGGTLELSDYNEDFALRAPDGKHIVDYGKQISGSKG